MIRLINCKCELHRKEDKLLKEKEEKRERLSMAQVGRALYEAWMRGYYKSFYNVENENEYLSMLHHCYD